MQRDDGEGDIYLPRRVTKRADGPAIWKRMYYRSRTEKGRRTFAQAEALFAQENNWGWPNRAWPFMPDGSNELDFYALVDDVPLERIRPEE